MITVLVVDDQPLVRAGLRTLLERDPGISVVGEAADGRSGVQVAVDRRPDVILMDIRMPGMDGIAATRELVGAAALPDTKVIVLTTFDDDEEISAAIHAGAVGYLLKDLSPDELRRAIHAVAAGDALLAPAITRRVMQQLIHTGRARPELIADLTEREREVLYHIGRGESNAAIATHLVITPATVRTYVSRLLAKLSARDRAQLVVLAYESGLLVPGKP